MAQLMGADINDVLALVHSKTNKLDGFMSILTFALATAGRDHGIPHEDIVRGLGVARAVVDVEPEPTRQPYLRLVKND